MRSVEALGAKLCGARRLEMLARLPGRLWPGAYGLMDDRLDMLARLPGRGGGAAMSPRVGVAGGWPKDSRPPFVAAADVIAGPCGSSIELPPLIVLPPARFLLLRTVTDAGI